ncbi:MULTISPECIES: helix-turn-helix transcriptional regulator [unclassified Enterococcus]|uniref:helix-turn-helix domain-containing protein n=1 Tax=unclassified Enterococcus TaxID=2608891 RepID=UPI0013E9AB13|nr:MULTISPECIES: helix-turn-helix transcriptional regulator [unclassified Enterococcus]
MNRIKALRQKHELTITKLAQDLELPQSTLTNYENGKREPRNKEIWKKIADYFNVSVAYIMGVSEQPDSYQTISEQREALLAKEIDPLAIEWSEEQTEQFMALTLQAITTLKNDRTHLPDKQLNLDELSDLSRTMIYNYARLNPENKHKIWNYTMELLESQEEKNRLEL